MSNVCRGKSKCERAFKHTANIIQKAKIFYDIFKKDLRSDEEKILYQTTIKERYEFLKLNCDSKTFNKTIKRVMDIVIERWGLIKI